MACADPETCLKVCSNPSGCSDIAYPKLVLELLPTGNAPYVEAPGAPRKEEDLGWGLIRGTDEMGGQQEGMRSGLRD